MHTRAAIVALFTPWLAAQQFVAAPLLAGDDTIAASAGNQGRPAVASGGGATLAVWEDDRSSRLGTVWGDAFGASVPTNLDVYGVLLDAGGRPLSAAPIAIAAGTWEQANPRVAANGSTFLVVFETTQPTASYRSKGIYGVRVAASGAVLDAVPFRIDDDPDVDEGLPAVAAVGGRWLVTWTDVDAGGLAVLGRRFVDSGGVVGPAATIVTAVAGMPPTEVAMAGFGNRAVLAWSSGWGAGVFAEVYDQNGARVGGRIALAATGGKPAIGAAAHGFYVAWHDGGFHGTPIDFAGVAAVPGGRQLAPIGTTYLPALAVAFDGGEWVVAYPAPPSVFAVRVATDGTVGATATVTTSPTSIVLAVSDIAAAGGNGSTTLLWTDRRLGLENIDSADVFSAVLTGTAATAAAPVSVSVPAQVNARLAPSLYGAMVVYESQTSGVTRILARVIDADGGPVLPQPVELAVGDRKLANPAVAWNGSEYLVTWGRLQTTDTAGPPPLIEARRCDPLGAPLDAAPFPVMEGAGPAVAAIGSTFLVAGLYRHLTLQYLPVMRCRRVDGTTGTLLDAAPSVIHGGAAGGTRMVALGNRWLVVFGNVVGAFVLADGTPQPVFQAAAAGSLPVGASTSWLDLCATPDGTSALLVFEHRWAGVSFADVHARRLDSGGASTDPLDGVPISVRSQSQLRPTAVALDDGFLCAWTDHRDSLEIEPGLGDVFAARLPFAGPPLDVNGLPVHDTVVAEGAVAALRTGRGRALLVASVLTPAAGAHRLAFTAHRSDSDLPWSSLGAGLAGTNGTPQLVGFGTLRAGEPFDVALASARGNSLAVTGLGVDLAMLPLLGGVLVPQPLLVIDHATDALGSSVLRTVFPAGLSGVHLYVQSWVLDPAAVQGVAATAGLHGIAP